MKTSRKKNKLATIITSILLVVLILGAVGGIVMLTRKDTGSVIIGIDGRKLSNGETLTLTPGTPLVFEVEGNEYSVKIIPNPDAPDFEFFAEGEFRAFKSETDLTQCFSVIKSETGFSLDAHYTFFGMGSILYPGTDVELVDEPSFIDTPYFLLQVTFGEDNYSFPFIADVSGVLTGITLNKEEIIF